jgi:hypothetical protein
MPFGIQGKDTMKILTIVSGVIASLIFSVGAGQALTPVEQLGKSIFFDTNLSKARLPVVTSGMGGPPASGWATPPRTRPGDRS